MKKTKLFLMIALMGLFAASANAQIGGALKRVQETAAKEVKAIQKSADSAKTEIVSDTKATIDATKTEAETAAKATIDAANTEVEAAVDSANTEIEAKSAEAAGKINDTKAIINTDDNPLQGGEDK